jgi:acetate kinase
MYNILIINAGSSSLKYQLFEIENSEIIAKGLAERIGIEGSMLTHCAKDKEKLEITEPMPSHKETMKLVLKALTDPEYGVIKDMNEINAVGHRVLHAADKFTQSVIINDDVIAAIRDCIKFGPLHNPANLMGIEACRANMPDTPMVAVFDTAFHQTMPRKAYLYGLPYEAYTKYGIRRYGFHGTSHKYLSSRFPKLIGRDKEDLKFVTCHLGNGSSMCAISGGKCVDTSMGLTPLAGVPMGTRCGDIDPAIVPYLMKEMNLTPDQMSDYMNKKSGMLGLSGVSSDFRDLWAAAEDNNERAKIALEVFCYNVKKYIGAYAAAMGGLDGIVFSGGIGENDARVRKLCTEGLEFLGAKLDPERNKGRGKEMRISTDDSKVEIWCVATNEEFKIAQETYELCCK